MAHTKAQKAAKGNKDSRSKRLGVKVYGGEQIDPGYIIVRQKGTKVRAGQGVLTGRDNTLMALRQGKVRFYKKLGKNYVSVIG